MPQGSSEIEAAVTRRRPFKVRIDNPFMGLANGIQAPIGYVMTGIECTAGVGGKYARDGISQLEITFTHIFDLWEFLRESGFANGNIAEPDPE